ncbi:hypothetical protein MKX07_006949 [Trichoderma sp. CBMAI-0711]|nr:hypothetical protein MKX07_006949 [Trichoderma sp. CBMAI-0711]
MRPLEPAGSRNLQLARESHALTKRNPFAPRPASKCTGFNNDGLFACSATTTTAVFIITIGIFVVVVVLANDYAAAYFPSKSSRVVIGNGADCFSWSDVRGGGVSFWGLVVASGEDGSAATEAELSASGVAAGVLTVFAWMGMWMDDDGGFGGVSGGLLRSMPSLMTTSVLILCFITLVFHEIHLLSPVVLLYLQAAILALATVAATSMWMKCVQEENGMVKAAVVWKVTSLGEAEGEGEGEGGGEGEGSGEEVQGCRDYSEQH